MKFRSIEFYISLLILCCQIVLWEISYSRDITVTHTVKPLDFTEIELFDSTQFNDSTAAGNNCTSFNYSNQPAYYFPAPDPQHGDSAYAQQFTAPRPETLLTVEFLVYDEQNGTFGNDNIYVTIYDDDGNGFPGVELARETLMAGTYPAYPALVLADFSDLGLILSGDYHVAFSSSGEFGEEYENVISSAEDDGVLRSTVSGHTGTTGWYTVLEHYGVDISFYFKVTTCKDVYTQCGFQSCHYPVTQTWALPGSDGRTMLAQKFAATTETCRLDKVRVRLIWPLGESSLPLYTYETRISVFSDSSGLPGSLLDSVTIGVDEYTQAGITQPGVAKTLVTGLNNFIVLLGNDVWVVVESLAPDSTTGIRIGSDGGGGDCNLGFAVNIDGWEYVADVYDRPEEIALAVHLGYCCVPGTCCPPHPSLIEIPIHYSSIQAGIDIAVDGDTVLVHPGTYVEAIAIVSKKITVASKFLTTGDSSYIDSTIIFGDNVSFSAYFYGPGSDSAKLIGFTLTHFGCPDSTLEWWGIMCNSSSPLIANNRIIDNCGGILSEDGDPTITNNLIARNTGLIGGGLRIIGGSPTAKSNILTSNSAFYGGAVFCLNGTVALLDNLIYANSTARGGVIFGETADVFVSGSTIFGNFAPTSGLFGLRNSNLVIDNSIIAFNSAVDSTWLCQFSPSTASFYCTNIFGNSGGDWNFCGTVMDSADNFSLNPLFCNPFSGDFRLNQYSPCAAINSPCGTLVGALDVGCTYLCGDATGDGLLNLSDIVFLHQYYFECGALPSFFSAGDANCDGRIDIGDIVYLAAHLNSTGPPPCCP